MKPLFLIICLSISVVLSSIAQDVIIPQGINLPIDTSVRSALLSSLHGFLVFAMQYPNNKNKFILSGDLPETSALLDEFRGLQRNEKLKDDNFYKPYLQNVTEIGDDVYLLQLSYMSVTADGPLLRASFKLLAKKEGAVFYFSSPLKQFTAGWKITKMGNIHFHYKEVLVFADSKAYLDAVSFDDKKLNTETQPIEFYYCDNFPEVEQILGIDYKMDYSGMKLSNITSHENNINLMINGWNSSGHRFDPHDLWHERLRNVMNADIINRPVDEGCAYLYGGSWGLNWPEVIVLFKKFIVENPNADWLNLYTTSKVFNTSDKPLRVPYLINALVVQKIEKEKGFSAVLPLLGCGKRETGDENYFLALHKISGINKGNFNKAVGDLIRGLSL
jgi:hypothetical protein